MGAYRSMLFARMSDRRVMGPWVLLLVGALMVGFLQALTWVHPPRASAATAAAAGEFVPLTQSRVVTSAPVTSGTTSSFQITGTGGVPASVSQVSAVVLTVTAASATASQWVSVWAEGATQPTTTLLTTVIGGSVANTVITKVGATGKVSVALGGGTANISLDVQGYYTTAATTTAAATFVALNHTRAYDTRAASSMGGRTTPLAAGETVTVPMLGQAGIPASGVAAVAVNVTALNTGTVSTFLQVWSGGTRPTNTSNVNAGAGKNASSLVQVAVSATGTISVYNNAATTNLVIDVEGYYKDVAGDAEDFFVPVNQARIYDSRTGLNAGGKTTPVPAKGTAAVPVCGAVALGATVPVPADANVDAVVLSLVVTGATTGGYARVYAEGDDFPTGTAMSWNTGQATTTQTLIAKVGPTGRISVYVSSQVHVVVDVQGYFQKTAIGAPPNPVVSSSVFTAGGWKASGTAGTFSFAAGGTPSPAVTQYRYAFDDASLAAPTVVNVAGNATGTTLSLTPADGWHTLYVQSANSAGNTSGVVAYTFGVGVGITSPKPNTSTGKQVTLSARAASTYGSVTWRWRRSASEPWANILEANVKNGTTAITAWPVTATVSGSSTIAPALTWDLASALGNVDTTVLVSACFTPIGGGTPACNTDASAPSVILDRVNAGGAETDLGIGSLNQLTGNVTLSAGDVNVPVAGSSLSLSRTFNTLAPTKTADAGSGVASIFGQGWTTGLPVDEAGSSWTGLAHRGSTVQVTDVDGFTTTFAKNAAGAWKPTGEDADSGLTLTSATGTAPATFTVSDLDGNTTRFKAATTLGGSPSPTAPNRYVVDIVTQPGSAQTTTYSYDSAGKPTQILAPVPTGSTCTSTTPGTGTWSGACRALLLTYGTTGGAAGKVTAVTLRTTTSAGAEVDVDQACYAYDTNGRLSAAWDPRDGGTVGAGLKPVACSATQYRPTTYTYDATTGRLLTVTPAGLAAYTLWYDTSGRVNRVSRTHTNTTVQRTDIAYDLPVTGDTANPQYRPDLSSTAIAAWGQSEAPATATAVFRPGKNASTSDLRWADVTYMDSAGRTVNTASYSGTGASGWHIDTTDYDDQGNVVRTLSATNREEALNVATAANPALKLPTDTRAAAAALSTVNVYAYDPSTGISDLTDTFGPFHMLSVNGLDTLVGARQHTKTYYDTGSELAHPAGGVLHLPVKVTVGASQSQLPVVTNETDIRTTTTDYALSSTDAAGWTFKAPMKVTTDPTGLAISKVTRYDTATGAVVESRQPNSAATTGADAGTTLTVYYSSAANATDPECGGKAAWATLVCKIKPAAQPPAATGMPGLVSKTFTYDYLSRPTVVTESVPDSAGVVKTRTTTTTYTLSGYGTDVVTVAQTGGLGTALPTVTTTYNATTGLAETVSNGTVTSRTGYDEFGRVVSYKENDTATGAAANTVTTVYDDTTGLVTSTTDAKGTVTNTYNSTTEYRNLVTSMTVSGITGAFSATYDTDGGLATQTWPNGVTQTITDDEAGETTSRNITGSGVTWLSEVLSSTTHGQTFRASYSGAEDYSGRRKYEYDAAGRLKTSYHRLLGPAYGDKGQCTTRTYTLDANGNRTFQRVFNPLSDGACQATTAASTMQHTYDIADRLRSATSDVGLVYDAFGRITTLPSADTADAGGNVTLGYYTNDMVRTQTRGTTTTTYTLDPAGRLATRATSGGATLVNHYDDASSDSPDWIAEDAAGTTWTRNITGLDGNLAATINQAGAITWQVTNAHGDVVATAPDGAVAPSNYYLTDEFGLGVSGWTSPSRYGWLGGKQRPGDTLGGLVLMGVRLYAPVLGRFLSTDPVAGGNENAYNYPNDPVNAFDLDGKSWRSKLWGGVKAAGKFAWKYKSTIGQIAGCAVSIAACAAITAAQFAYRSYKRGSTYGWGRDTWRGIAGDAVMTAATFAIKAPVGRYLKTSGYWRSMSKVRKFGLSTAMGAPGYLHTAAGTYYGMTGRRHWLYNQGGRRSSIGQRLAYQSIYS